jgi:hypothetical protein
MRLGVLLTLAVLFLAGCATQAEYERKLDSWIGASAQDLVRAWGYPARIMRGPHGGDVYHYASRETVTTARNYSALGYARLRDYDFTCDVWFDIDNGRVARWTYRGNDCY